MDGLYTFTEDKPCSSAGRTKFLFFLDLKVEMSILEVSLVLFSSIYWISLEDFWRL